MDTFKKFFTNHRHRRGYTDHDRNYNRKHLNLVPDYMKTDASLNSKIEKLRDRKGREVCNSTDLTYIRDKYKIVPIKGKTKRLGSTGIKIFFDDSIGKFILMK